jgi:hypothetical protein
MSRLEMAQEAHKAERDNDPVEYWVFQTRTGEKMLGLQDTGEFSIRAQFAPKPRKVVDCPICDTLGCIVCNYSGITKPNHWRQWRDWQLEDIRRRRLTPKAAALAPSKRI